MDPIEKTAHFFKVSHGIQSGLEKDILAKHHTRGHVYVPLQKSDLPIPNDVIAQSISQSSAVPSQQAPRTFFLGNDPVKMIGSKSQDRSLLYGLQYTRGTTMKRLMGSISLDHTTIDDYNTKIGITEIMTSSDRYAGLLEIRSRLKNTENWRFPSPQLNQWIDTLALNKEKIGLEDFGEPGRGVQKLESKNYLTKNLPPNLVGKISAAELSHFLAPNQNDQSILTEFMQLPQEKQAAINTWISNEFFRRTSKLGMDFAVNTLKTKIHFNTAGAKDFASDKTIVPGGLIESAKLHHEVDRPITISEWRHLQKMGEALREDVNIYDEYDEDLFKANKDGKIESTGMKLNKEVQGEDKGIEGTKPKDVLS